MAIPIQANLCRSRALLVLPVGRLGWYADQAHSDSVVEQESRRSSVPRVWGLGCQPVAVGGMTSTMKNKTLEAQLRILKIVLRCRTE